MAEAEEVALSHDLVNPWHHGTVPNVLFLQHDHVSPPGPLAERFVDRGFDVSMFQIVPAERWNTPNVDVELPDLTSFDAVVPLGSPWSVYDSMIERWFTREVTALKEADQAGVPVLGVCFGAQALAVAHGGSVARAQQHEIGWFTVESAAPQLIAPGWWFQYHFDEITPPPEAAILATSPRALQAFSLRRNLAVQFHPEATTGLLELWLDPQGMEEVRQAGVSIDELRSTTAVHVGANQQRAFSLVDAFLDSVATVQ